MRSQHRFITIGAMVTIKQSSNSGVWPSLGTLKGLGCLVYLILFESSDKPLERAFQGLLLRVIEFSTVGNRTPTQKRENAAFCLSKLT